MRPVDKRAGADFGASRAVGEAVPAGARQVEGEADRVAVQSSIPASEVPTEPGVLQVFDDSLRRCSSDPRFFDRFYELFMASSPKVREKFVHTNFVRQKRALNASLHLILLVAQDPDKDAARYLGEVAEQHSSKHLAIGAELYDLWLDSLLASVREFDPQFGPAVEKAWEDAMAIGIRFLCSRY